MLVIYPPRASGAHELTRVNYPSRPQLSILMSVNYPHFHCECPPTTHHRRHIPMLLNDSRAAHTNGTQPLTGGTHQYYSTTHRRHTMLRNDPSTTHRRQQPRRGRVELEHAEIAREHCGKHASAGRLGGPMGHVPAGRFGGSMRHVPAGCFGGSMQGSSLGGVGLFF